MGIAHVRLWARMTFIGAEIKSIPSFNTKVTCSAFLLKNSKYDSPRRLPRLEPALVIVPSPRVTPLVDPQIARIRVFFARNASSPFPLLDFIDSLPPDVATPNLPKQRIAPEEVVWAIHRVLPNLLKAKEFSAVRGYLSDSDPLKLFQLCQRTANLFDQIWSIPPKNGPEMENGDRCDNPR